LKRTLPILVFALGWIACSGFGPRAEVKVSEAERRDYANALSVLADDPAAAEQRMVTFVEDWPQSPLSGDASIRLAEMALARGDQDDALTRYYYVVLNFPHGNRIDSARVGAASIEFDRGNVDAAMRALNGVQLRRLSDAERQTANRLLAGGARDPVAKIGFLATLRSGEPDEQVRARIDAQLDDLLAQLDRAQLALVAKRVEPEIPAARALLVSAEQALDVGDFDGARSRIERASRMQMAPAYATRLALAADRLRVLESGRADTEFFPTFEDAASVGLPSTSDAQGSIGVVLPLSGNFADFGEEALRGILLAAGTFDAHLPIEERPRVRIEIRDSEGSPAVAAAAVRELAQEKGITAIIGPLLSKECEAAAVTAENQRVPLLALTSREQVASGRSYVFRVRTTPSDEAQTLADYAMRELGAQRFAILYPRDAYGSGLSGLFWNAVEERGGRVVALAAYDAEAVDFGSSIRRLVGYELLTPEEEEMIEEREKLIRSARRLEPEEASLVREEARSMLGPDDDPLPPIVDFDAIFIPESHEKVALIAPQLAFHEATGAVLLGTDAWNHPDLVSIARKHVEGAYFTASFYGDSSVGYVRAFADRYLETFGAPADEFSAGAYDAANLVLVQLARGATSRNEMRDRFLDVKGFPGVSGVLSMGVDGNARKRPFLLSVRRGQIVEAD
jgi:ABC-type branched-subunit amino acid transport system substrate-binding protein/predicted negative regulator of RcsB-dependent stress response